MIPILAAQISTDREYGRLGTGRTVDASYVTQLMQRYQGVGSEKQVFGDELERALKYLQGNPPSSRIDITA